MAGEEYLGDGLYASVEGGMIKLRAPREGGDSVIWLDPEVWAALVQWVDRAKSGDPLADD
jgi:hypothetical protein